MILFESFFNAPNAFYRTLPHFNALFESTVAYLEKDLEQYTFWMFFNYSGSPISMFTKSLLLLTRSHLAVVVVMLLVLSNFREISKFRGFGDCVNPRGFCKDFL